MAASSRRLNTPVASQSYALLALPEPGHEIQSLQLSHFVWPAVSASRPQADHCIVCAQAL